MTIHTEIFRTAGGVEVKRQTEELPIARPLASLLERLNTHRGAVFASGYEYPGRYSRWDIGFVDPPLELVARQRAFAFRALNARGEMLLEIFRGSLAKHEHVTDLELTDGQLKGAVAPMPEYFPEEERSKQPTIFSVPARLGGTDASRGRKSLGVLRGARL